MHDVVKTYFETYLDACLSDLAPGELRVCPSDRRMQKEEGWSRPFAVWAFLLDDCGVISVRPDLADAVQRIIADVTKPRELLSEEMQCSIQGACGVEFTIWSVDILSCGLLDIRMHSCSGCRRMVQTDVETYISFKKAMWPESDAECCTKDILRNIRDGIAYGVFQDSKLVSHASAPHVGFMQDMIEEPGVETLSEYRRRGFGKSALAHTTRAILDLGRVPVYRLSQSNVASLRSAEAVGYQRIAQSVRFAPKI